MKSLHKIFAITLLGCLLLANPSFAQKSTFDKQAKIVREATEKINGLVDDCDKNKNKIQKQIEAAKAAFEKCKEAANALKTKEAEARSTSAKEKAKAESDAAQETLEEVGQLLKDAMARLKGIKAADAIIEALGEADVSTNTGKEKVRDELIEEVRKAGFNNPCDSSLVAHAVKEKVKEFEDQNRVKNNSEIKPWFEKLGKDLKDKKLISMPMPGDKYIYAQRDGNGASSHPHFVIELIGGLHINTAEGTGATANQLLDEVQQQVYNDPALFEKLFERLGGEFFIGNFSQPAQPQNLSRTNSRSIGLGGKWNISDRWAVEGSISRAKSEVRANFPVIIFAGNTGETKTEEGHLKFQFTEFRCRLGADYYAGNGAFRPFAGGGIQYFKSNLSGAEGQIGGLVIPSDMGTSNHSIGAYGAAGFEVHPGGGIYFKASATAAFEKTKGMGTESATALIPAVGIGVGWAF